MAFSKNDIIKVNHSLYAHYGVYVDGGKVIHYTDDNGRKSDFKGRIQETSLEIFLNGAKSYSVVEFTGSVYSPEETVRRARSKIGQEDYNFFSHNCEHFAFWCKTGIEESSQVSNYKPSRIFDGIFSFMTGGEF